MCIRDSSYVIRVSAPDLDELKRRCDEVKDFYDDLNVKLVRPAGDMLEMCIRDRIKDENAELIINGERVENDYTFTADSESMEVQIAFTFDASELGGKELVTFEELYDLSNPDEPTKVTEHKDIEDDGQTVTITEVPEMPEEPTEPEQPTTPDTPSKTTEAPKTGDNTNIALSLIHI